MNKDLYIIKKKFGEEMMHFCRSHFSTLLEETGLLSSLLLEHFESNHDLYGDIIIEGVENDFKNYIYSLVNEPVTEIESEKSVVELFDEAGYNFYECKTEKEIQSFKKYYEKDEELCTFDENRLKKCFVFFAVKKDVDKIKRCEIPSREDIYGTSVISIQFTRDSSHVLSIKNRYNHTVNNPDATFSNNLEHIIPGLTNAFINEYNLEQSNKNHLDLSNYVLANDNKYYKYNHLINNIYYCPGNIIIDNGKIKRYDKEKYIIMDYFILDLMNKTISLYDNFIDDSFIDLFGDELKIEIVKEKYKKITINDEIFIGLNSNNAINMICDNGLRVIRDKFLYYNEGLEYLEMNNLIEIGSNFLFKNIALKELELPNVIKIGNSFMHDNMTLSYIKMPELKYIGSSFLTNNLLLTNINFPNLTTIGDDFISDNENINNISLPNLIIIGDYFMFSNVSLNEISLPKILKIGNGFLRHNDSVTKLSLPNVMKIDNTFLTENKVLEEINIPIIEEVGQKFLTNNENLKEIDCPILKVVGTSFIKNNSNLRYVNLPSVEKVGHDFLKNCLCFDNLCVSSKIKKKILSK